MKSCVVLSVPRAGTHLIMKLLMMLGLKEYFCYNAETKAYCFSILPEKGYYAFGAHASPCKKHYKQIKKGIFITRDPRDIVISTYFNARKTGDYPQLNNLSMDQWLIDFIKGWPEVYANLLIIPGQLLHEKFLGVGGLFKQQLAWRNRPGIYSTKYEKFTEEESRKKEIINITSHLEITLTKEKLEYCIKNLLGSNPSYPERFRKGITGDWKNYFTKEHRIAFDQVAGDILIKEGYEKDHSWVNET